MSGMVEMRPGTLMMAFNKRDKVPEVGQTVEMHGSFGVRYAVTVHRIYSRRETEHYTYLKVRATKRAIENDDRQPAAAMEMLRELVAAVDASYVDIHPFAGPGHSKIVGPFQAAIDKARALLARDEGAGEDEGSAEG